MKQLEFITRINRPLLTDGREVLGSEVIKQLTTNSATITLVLEGKEINNQSNAQAVSDKRYQIKVKPYMTKPSTPDFDFMDKYNNGVPMPYRIMVGNAIEQTPKMVKMHLRAELISEVTTLCMKCGRTLTNQVSKYFGIGPECGGHSYTNPFNSKEELNKAVEYHNKQLAKVEWIGWIPKSAIMERTEVE